MRILEKIKQNKKIHYIGKAVKHISDPKYVEFYLDMESNPRLLYFKKNGEQNKAKAIYVITENGNRWGYFAEFRAMLCKLLYADRMGFFPYINWRESFLYFDKEKETDIPNAFEYFFKQVNGLTLEEVEISYMVAYSKSAEAVMIEREFKDSDSYAGSDDFLKIMGDIYRKYISLNFETEQKLEKEYGKLLGDFKTLGVHFRGTDYRREYDIHPVFVQVQEEIEEAYEIFNRYGYERVFLATDEKDAIKEFERKFGKDKICYYNDTFRGSTDISVAFSESQRKHHKYKLGYEVLRDMWTLSKCSGLVAGVSQVGTCARILKESRREIFEQIKIIDKGVNHNKNKFESRRPEMDDKNKK